jgi:hypothetical protein
MSGDGDGDLESETRVCKRWIARRQERVRKRRRETRPLHIYNGKNVAHVAHCMRQPTQRFNFHTNTLQPDVAKMTTARHFTWNTAMGRFQTYPSIKTITE